jgi:hypothetical protein
MCLVPYASTHDTLISDFVMLVHLLHLPEKDQQDQHLVIAAVKQWLVDHTGWLLILDNADDLELVSDFLPVGGQGHILLTTRAHATGTLESSIKMEILSQEEGTLLLLRRAKVLASAATLEQATDQSHCGLLGNHRTKTVPVLIWNLNLHLHQQTRVVSCYETAIRVARCFPFLEV